MNGVHSWTASLIHTYSTRFSESFILFFGLIWIVHIKMFSLFSGTQVFSVLEYMFRLEFLCCRRDFFFSTLVSYRGNILVAWKQIKQNLVTCYREMCHWQLLGEATSVPIMTEHTSCNISNNAYRVYLLIFVRNKISS